MNLANYRTSIILAVSFTILLSMFWFYQDFAFIIFLSLLLQLLLKPAVDFMAARRMPRVVASALAICAFILVLLHPVAVILGIVFGGEILGAAGMFLAVPFMVIVKIVITDIYRDRQEMKAGEPTI